MKNNNVAASSSPIISHSTRSIRFPTSFCLYFVSPIKKEDSFLKLSPRLLLAGSFLSFPFALKVSSLL